MKRLIAIMTTVLLGIVLMTQVTADNEEKANLMAAMSNLGAAYEAGDADTIAQTYLPESEGFLQDGGLLVNLQQQAGDDVSNLKAVLEAGGKFKFQISNLNVKMYGNTGIVTAYVEHIVTLPDGRVEKDPTYRHSSAWMKTEGKWQILHMHHSPLAVEPPVDLENLEDR